MNNRTTIAAVNNSMPTLGLVNNTMAIVGPGVLTLARHLLVPIIVAFVDREMKPETDPDWEENAAKRKAKRQRVRDDA